MKMQGWQRDGQIDHGTEQTDWEEMSTYTGSGNRKELFVYTRTRMNF